MTDTYEFRMATKEETIAWATDVVYRHNGCVWVPPRDLRKARRILAEVEDAR